MCKKLNLKAEEQNIKKEENEENDMKKDKKRFLSAVIAMFLVVIMCVQPVAGAESPGIGADAQDGTKTAQGAEEIPEKSPEKIKVVSFDALVEEVKNKEAATGTPLEKLGLPDSLGISEIREESAEAQSGIVENITWKVDPENPVNKENAVTEYLPEREGITVFTPILPQNYVVEESVKLPEITVEVRSSSTVSTYAFAEEGTGEPTAFAMKDKLLNGFDTIAEGARDETNLGELDGGFRESQQVFFGKDYLGEDQKWWITGTDPENPENLVLFASDTLLAPMRFREEEWTSTEFLVEGSSGEEEYKFGTWKSSSVKAELEKASGNPNLFSAAEQKLMLESTIETLSRARLFKTEHPDMPLNAWKEFQPEYGDDLFGWENYKTFPQIDTVEERSHIRYAVDYPELYYKTEDILYAPYGEKEYEFPTVGSGHGTRASTGTGNAISRSFLIENKQSNRNESGNEGEKMPFWLRSPGTYYTNLDNDGAQWHEIGRDCALLAGYFDEDNGSNNSSNIAIAHNFDAVEQDNLYENKAYAVQPAFQLDTSNVLFGSSAEAAANHANEVENGDALAVNEAMTLRYDAGTTLGTATVTESEPDENGNQHQQVEVKGAPKGTYLVVQDIISGYDVEAWAIPVEGNKTISLEDVLINGQSVQEVVDGYEADDEVETIWGNAGFPSEYRIWLEKTEDKVTKATLADYRVSVRGEELIEITGGTITPETNTSTQNFQAKSTYDPKDGYVDMEDWIWEENAQTVTCKAKEGYYFPKDYLEKHKIEARKYGIEAKISEDRKTLTVTFESRDDSGVDEDGNEYIFYFHAPYAARTIVLPAPEKIPQNLTISKTVVNDEAGTAEEISGKAAEEFDFTLSLKDESGKPLENQELEITGIDGKPGTLQLNNGSATFTLSHDQQITVNHLPNGITYEITETPVENYSPQYAVTEKDADHTKVGGQGIQNGSTATGTIHLGKDVTVAYTNTYTPGFPVSFIKVDEETNKPLSEAEFKLYSCTNTEQSHTHSELAGEESEKEGCWTPVLDEKGKPKVYQSDGNGKVDLGHLKYDEYMLVETKAPNGYELPKAQWLLTVSEKGIEFEIKGDKKGPQFRTNTGTDGTVTYQLPNKKKITELLPETGGKGTYLIYLMGIGLVLIGCVAGRKRRPQ